MWSFYCSGTLDQTVILNIFIASLRAVGCAATLATAGLWLARNGLMTPSLSKGLSQLSVKVAIPALLFSSMVPGISFELLGYAMLDGEPEEVLAHCVRRGLNHSLSQAVLAPHEATASAA